MLRFATIAAALTFSATAAFAQASSTPTAASGSATIQAGTYDLEIAFGGGTMAGSLVITTVGDSVGAKINVGDHGPPPVRSIKRSGSSLTIEAGDAGTNIVWNIKFDGDNVAGKFTFNGDPGLVTGKRRK